MTLNYGFIREIEKNQHLKHGAFGAADHTIFSNFHLTNQNPISITDLEMV